MSRPSPRVTGSPTMPRRKWLAFATALSAVFLAGGLPLAAQTCDRSGCGTVSCATPATPAPPNLWAQGELQPVDLGQLPPGRDSTGFHEFGQQYSSYPWFTGIDIENGYALVSLAYGLQILDLHGDPANPTVLGNLSYGNFPTWTDSAEDKWPLVAVDAPSGVDNIAAVVGHSGIGIAIVDLNDKTRPHVLYQNDEKQGEEVYTATIGGAQYAFMAASGGNPGGGLYMYNMSQARQYNGCLEALPAPGEPVQCPNVFMGRLGTRNPAYYVHGVDNFVVASSGSGRGIDIWDVSNPLSPQLKLNALGSQSVYGVAMWKGGNSHYYLGLRTDTQGQIYDVSCVAGTCGGLGGPIWSQTMDTGTANFFVTLSQAGGSPFLYFGSDNKCGGGSQREWLFDVSNPAAPHDLSPATGYWGWYYRGGLTGFNNMMPRRGKFNGAYFYRAALSIFDIHKRTGGVPPVADFTWSPNPAYSGAGNPVTFTDLSSGAPILEYTWSFSGSAGPIIASSKSPSPVVTFSSPGTATVTLVTRNAAGISNLASKTITVADSAPAIASVAAAPNPATLCQPVTFTGNGVTGQPTLNSSWVVKSDATQANVASGNGTSLVWTPPSTTPVGTYTGSLTVSNGLGSVSKSVGVTIIDLPNLQFTGATTPTADPFTAGTVQFHAPASQGATTWTWDFGDGTTDSTQGANPTHTYQTVGGKNVVVQISNCKIGPVTSQTLAINIQQTTPLAASFAPGLFCQFGQCFATVGVPVGFTDSSTGAQFWDYDWTHIGADPATCSNFTDTAHTSAVAAHTYTATGNFQPCLRVRRGTEQNIAVGPVINVSSANPPTISITGSTLGQTGQTLGYSGSANNCSPDPAGWSWTMIGGTPSSGTGSAITVAYATAGTYTITVTNSGCPGASGGTLSVVVSTTSDGGGSLAAAFGFTPGAPGVGQSVTFDGSASTGGPTQYSWSFGDGSNGSGAAISHTYNAPGSYSVTLTVTKAGQGTGCFSGICASDLTKTVVVGGGSLSAAFTFSPGAPNAGQAVTFDASSATGNPSQYSWTFGDGSNTTGQIVLHAFATTGTYPVKLTVSAPGTGAGCSSGTCVSEVTKQVIVTAPPLDATFQSSAQCVLQFGFNQCNAQTGASVSLTANTTQATSYAWDFGDGTTGSGQAVNHTWGQPGSYSVRLTVANAQTNAAQTTLFVLTGPPVVVPPPPPPPPPKVAVTPVLLPWVAESRGVLVQTSDLYIHNPGTEPVDVTLEFRKRGTPDVNPPRATITIQPGQTQFNADVLGNLFNRENLTGFISLSVSKGTTQPIITSFNTVTHADGSKYAQAVSGIPMPPTPNAATPQASIVQHLVGLNDNSDRTAVFGVTNPGAAAATYHLSFFDSRGQEIGHPSDLVLSPFGQRQFQLKEIRSTFGITATDDYRVKVETTDGGQFYPYDSDLRNGSNDPSYFGAGSGKSSKVYLIGALSTPDPAGNLWKTDMVLSNITDQPMPVTIGFTRIGLRSTPERPVAITLQPGETQRLANVISSKWKINDATGVLTVQSAGVSGSYPIVQGESYDNTHSNQYGQVMTAFTDADAAGPGQVHYLVGLRQNADYRSQLWLFNPATESGSYDLIYRALDGSILGQIKSFTVSAGTTRQVRPVDNPLPAKGVTGGFTVQIVVHTGKVLAGAQVVNNATNDPAYVSGKTQ